MNDSTERFWAGSFDDAYVDSNGIEMLPGRIAMFSRILRAAPNATSFVELGANIGLNLLALRALIPDAKFQAVELNTRAYGELSRIPGVRATHGSLFEYRPSGAADFAFTCGVLIHIEPARLQDAYRVLYDSAQRYLLICEYYNPTPIEAAYHGHTGKLFKRDFAGELLERYPDLRLVDYGFVYRRDPTFAADDVTWFLMTKPPLDRRY